MLIKDCVSIKTGKLNANASSVNGKYPFYTCADTPLKIDTMLDDCECVLLVGNGANTGMVFYNNGPFNAYQRTYILRSRKVFSNKYLFWYLKSKTLFLLGSSIGSATNYIKLGDIENLEIKERPAEEQKEAINTFERLEMLINYEKEKLHSFDELIKSRFIELFMDCDRDKYPLKKWKEVVIIKHGKDYKKNISDKGGYPVYGSGGFMGLYANNYLVNENSIIIGRKGTIDKPLFIKEKFWNVDTAFGIEVNKQILNPIFFYIRSTMYNLKAYSTSTTLPSMTKDSLCEIEIGIPPLDLQNGFADFVETIDKSKFINQIKSEDFSPLSSSTAVFVPPSSI